MMAVVRSPDFLRALIRETALATLIHQRRLTPSCGGQAPTAERTVGQARMIAESLTPKPGIREQSARCGRSMGAGECLFMGVGSIGQCNTARSLSAGVSKPKVFRGR